jgi:hypothetical protein
MKSWQLAQYTLPSRDSTAACALAMLLPIYHAATYRSSATLSRSVGLGRPQRSQRNDGSAFGRGVVSLRYYARLLVDVTEDGLVVAEGGLARILKHSSHMLCLKVRYGRPEASGNIPQPYAICAIWLLGTIFPFAFFTTLGDASDAVLGATAIESIVSHSRLWT